MLEKIKNLTAQQKKILIGAIAAVGVALVVVVALLVAPLFGGQNPPVDAPEESGVRTYTINLNTAGGKAFEKIEMEKLILTCIRSYCLNNSVTATFI